jgi:hypothetical protein
MTDVTSRRSAIALLGDPCVRVVHVEALAAGKAHIAVEPDTGLTLTPAAP